MGSEQIITRPAEPTRHRITVAEFLALDEAGFFDDHRVELIDGEIYEMSPLYMGHGRVAAQLLMAIGSAVDELDCGLEALTPVSAHLDATSLPEADIIVASPGKDDKFVTRETVRILVEVSASSLNHDLGPKLRLYARSGVPEYWVADVSGEQILRFSAPEGERYLDQAEFRFGEPVPSATIAGLTIDTARLARP